ncbi:MAG: hypothetical protein HY696_11415 [Deltaproteobacteria bacterium]|nr:hypothetical protein [Deltaproteobacteria bacterium]
MQRAAPVALRAPGAPTAHARVARFVPGTVLLARRLFESRVPPAEDAAPRRAERPPHPSRSAERARRATQHRNTAALAGKLSPLDLIAPLSNTSDPRRCIYASALRQMAPDPREPLVIRYHVAETPPEERDFALGLARMTSRDPVTLEIELLADRDPALAFANLIDEIRFRTTLRHKLDRFAACFPPLADLQRVATECDADYGGLAGYCADLVDRISDAWITVEVLVKGVEHATQLMEQKLAVPPAWQHLLVDWHLDPPKARMALTKAALRRYHLTQAPWSPALMTAIARNPLRIVQKRPAPRAAAAAAPSLDSVVETLDRLGFLPEI